MSISVEVASPSDADTVAELVRNLLEEIMQVTGGSHFQVDLPQMISRARTFLETGQAQILLARSGGRSQAIGLLALSECHALYAEGSFGIITELYVAPAHRSAGVGHELVERAKQQARRRGWKRLEVTTPPLPAFERTIRFYESQGFSISGGRKLKVQV